MQSSSQPTHLRLTLWIALLFAGYNILVRLSPYLLEKAGVMVSMDAAICPWNYSPMMALCLFGAARFMQGKLVWAVTLGSFLASDLLLGLMMGWNYAFYPTFYIIYAAFAVGILLGGRLRKTNSFAMIFGTGILAEVVFFLTTNFASWLAFHGQPPTNYAFSFGGLLQAYYFGLPFFGRSLLSTLTYGTLLFGAWAWISQMAKTSAAAEVDGATS